VTARLNRIASPILRIKRWPECGTTYPDNARKLDRKLWSADEVAGEVEGSIRGL
jgi:hypothetical protein